MSKVVERESESAECGAKWMEVRLHAGCVVWCISVNFEIEVY